VCVAQRGKTPLHHAAMKGHGDVIELLVNAGADVDREDKVQ
jgi:ankyrin repeat protein